MKSFIEHALLLSAVSIFAAASNKPSPTVAIPSASVLTPPARSDALAEVPGTKPAAPDAGNEAGQAEGVSFTDVSFANPELDYLRERVAELEAEVERLTPKFTQPQPKFTQPQPVKAKAQPVYCPPQRLNYSSCGPGGCSPGFFRRRR